MSPRVEVFEVSSSEWSVEMPPGQPSTGTSCNPCPPVLTVIVCCVLLLQKGGDDQDSRGMGDSLWSLLVHRLEKIVNSISSGAEKPTVTWGEVRSATYTHCYLVPLIET